MEMDEVANPSWSESALEVYARSNLLFFCFDPGLVHVGWSIIAAVRTFDPEKGAENIANGFTISDVVVVARGTFALRRFHPMVSPDEAAVMISEKLSNGLVAQAFPIMSDGTLKTYEEVHILIEQQYFNPKAVSLSLQLIVAEAALHAAIYMAVRTFNYNATFPRTVKAMDVKKFYGWGIRKKMSPDFKVKKLAERKDVRVLGLGEVDQHQADAVWMALFMIDGYKNSILPHNIKGPAKNDREGASISSTGTTNGLGANAAKGPKAKRSRPGARKNNPLPQGGTGQQGAQLGDKQADQAGVGESASAD